MGPGDALQLEIGRVALTLRRRAASSGDAAERAGLAQLLGQVEAQAAGLAKADLLRTAAVLAELIDALEAALGLALRAPFDGYLSALEAHFEALAQLSAALHAEDALPPAPETDAAAGEGGARSRSSRGAAAVAAGGYAALGLAPPATAIDFASLKDEYARWYELCEIRPAYKGELAYYLKRLNQGRGMYEQVAAEFGIPWAFIGILHGMECGFNFAGHLHNGDPLTARTVQVPRGRPLAGSPPFTWSQSARDALVMKGYHQVSDWSVPSMLYLFERYNGMGYRKRGLPSPYLWSYSKLYEKGKFVADGHFDADAVSKQCGAALMLKAIQV